MNISSLLRNAFVALSLGAFLASPSICTASAADFDKEQVRSKASSSADTSLKILPQTLLDTEHVRAHIDGLFLEIKNKYTSGTVDASALGLPLFTKSMNEYERAGIIEVLAKIQDPLTRTSVATLAHFLLRDTIRDYDKLDAISILWRIKDVTTFISVVILAPPLFTKSMTGYDRAEIIAALSEIQDTETRTSVATLVKILFDESVYEFDKKEIIQSLTTMPDEQTRISVITLAKPFFAGATYNDGNKIIDILLSLAFIKNLDTRAYTVSLAPLFFTENMGIGDRSEIIDALSEIQDKDSLTQASILAPPLFTKSMTGYDKAEIIRDF